MQEVEHLELQRGELRLEDLHDVVPAHQAVALDAGEDLEDARSARGRAVPKLGIEGDGSQRFGLHRGAARASGSR